MPFCTACGKNNPDDARFCAQCGTRLVSSEGSAGSGGQVSDTTTTISAVVERVETSDRDLSAVDAAAVDGLPVGSALLIVQKGPGSGSRFLLDTDLVTVGRHPDSSIFLDDVTVSRRHVEFRRTGGEFEVRDVGSLNGTYVNRDRIDSITLTDGDEVQIGKYRLVFFAGHAG